MLARRRSLPLAAVMTVAVAVAGCGDSDDASTPPTATVAPTTPTATATNPVATAPGATTPPPDATPPPTRTDSREPRKGGGPVRSQRVRVPAAFVVRAGGGLAPPTITVPPLLAVELSIRAQDGRPHTLVVQTPTPARLDVQAGGRAAVLIAGLRAGRYAVELDGRRAGTLVAGGEVGP